MESTEALMLILFIGESALYGEWNHLCSHKARGPVDNDSVENVFSTVDVTSMGSLVVGLCGRVLLEHRHIKVMSISARIS